MGRLTTLHRQRLDAFLTEMDAILDDLGQPFVPELQDRVVDFLQPFIKDVEDGKIKASSFLKNSYGHFWREISEHIALKFPEEHRPMRRGEDARTKARFKWDKIYVHDVLLKYDSYTKTELTPTYKIIQEWRTACNERSAAETQHRKGCKVEWGNPEYQALFDLAMRCLQDRGATETDNERCVRLIYALTFFTGRRPWEEVGRISVFREADAPDDEAAEHADDWLEVEGIGKKSDDADDKLIIPVFNISSLELVEAMIELRMIESSKPWFSLTRDKGATASTDIIGTLGYQWNVLAREKIDPCFERVIANGFNFDHNKSKGKGHSRFNAYDLRRMYCSYGFWRYNEWCVENGFEPWEDAVPWARTYLGHVESKNEQQTATYLGFKFRGDEDLSQRSGLKANPYSSREPVAS